MMIHPTQQRVLEHLKAHLSARFNELKPKDMTSDHVNFHIKGLRELQLVSKSDDGLYQLSTKGKVHLRKKLPKVSILFAIHKQVDGIDYFVTKRRKQHPFFDHLVFPTCALEYGVSFVDAASAYLDLSTGLKGAPEAIGNIRRMDTDPDSGEVLNDHILIVSRVTNTQGSLSDDHLGGTQSWKTKNDMLSDAKLTGLPQHIFRMLEEPLSPQFVEYSQPIDTERF